MVFQKGNSMLTEKEKKLALDEKCYLGTTGWGYVDESGTVHG